jgi:hypothetical protein
MWVKIKIKEQIRGQQQTFNLRVKMKRIKTLTKGEKIKRMRTKMIKIIHYKLGLNGEVKKNYKRAKKKNQESKE